MLRRALLVAFGTLVLAGCRDASAPSDPVWGKQACAHCKMLVSDPQFAAQALTPASEHIYFDDVGCLASYLPAHSDVKATWVRDASGHWLETRTARFRGGAKTPMDFGFVVDATGPLDFKAVSELVASKNRGGS